MSLTVAFALFAAQEVPPPPESEDIVVVAQGRRKCRVEFADRAMSDSEFRARAAVWAAGTPVRVVASSQADIKCLSRIAFRLADRGVRLIEFVTPADAARERAARAAALTPPTPDR